MFSWPLDLECHIENSVLTSFGISNFCHLFFLHHFLCFLVYLTLFITSDTTLTLALSVVIISQRNDQLVRS